jgi:hypothetical protein
MYDEQDYIEVAKEGFGFGHRGNYKYRVLDRQKVGVTHHTNCIEDAKKWLRKCRSYWVEQDELAR